MVQHYLEEDRTARRIVERFYENHQLLNRLSICVYAYIAKHAHKPSLILFPMKSLWTDDHHSGIKSEGCGCFMATTACSVQKWLLRKAKQRTSSCLCINPCCPKSWILCHILILLAPPPKEYLRKAVGLGKIKIRVTRWWKALCHSKERSYISLVWTRGDHGSLT